MLELSINCQTLKNIQKETNFVSFVNLDSKPEKYETVLVLNSNRGWKPAMLVNSEFELNGYRLEKIGTLPFEHFRGACSVMANQFIYLCFNFASYYVDPTDWKRCRWATGPLETFTEITLSNYDHIHTPISSSESKFSSESLNHNLFSDTGCRRITLCS